LSSIGFKSPELDGSEIAAEIAAEPQKREATLSVFSRVADVFRPVQREKNWI
jgi:hypothetical protein